MTHWINNLRISRKFLLIGALAFFMFAIPTTVLVHLNWDTLRTVERENLGVRCRQATARAERPVSSHLE